MLYQTHVRVHLNNIRSNIEAVRQAVGPNRKILIAVKANAYGHGAVEVSRMAENIGVDWLGVATVPEGLQLREAGIRLPILKLTPAFPEEMDRAVRSNLTLCVCEIENINALNQICQAANLKANVHLKVDTGMGRIGVPPADAPALASHIEQNCPNLYLEGIFTHLPSSDETDPAYTQNQIDRFKAVVAAVNETLGRRVPLAHCANSGAVLEHESGWLDMVRPGIIVYGFPPSPDMPKTIPLLPGLSFITRVSFLKKVSAGTSIGYGRTWTAPEDTWIATIPAGYADGFNRLFSNRGRVLINGHSYPIVGRVCMDQSMVNLGPETTEEITCEEWAQVLNTITYEVTCQINARVERIYERS